MSTYSPVESCRDLPLEQFVYNKLMCEFLRHTMTS